MSWQVHNFDLMQQSAAQPKWHKLSNVESCIAGFLMYDQYTDCCLGIVSATVALCTQMCCKTKSLLKKVQPSDSKLATEVTTVLLTIFKTVTTSPEFS